MSRNTPSTRGAHIAFDIETDGLFDGDEPPGITCCATRLVYDGGAHVRYFHSNFGPKMTPADIGDLVEYLYALHRAGVTVVTFNGGGFDFKVVHAYVKDDPKLNEMTSILAREHVDIMFEFACTYGYYASMNSFCAGSKLTTKNGSGADAIGMWVGPSATDSSRAAVLAYCANDVRCLSDLYLHVLSNGGAKRITKRGATREVKLHVLPVNEAARAYTDNPPDVGWLDQPPDILGAVAWCGV